jgi:hypothetical protein
MSWPYPPRSRRRTLGWVIGSVAAVLVVAIAAFIVINRNDSGAGGAKAATIEETRPVTVTGDPLPKQPSFDKDLIGTPLPRIEGQSFDGTPVVIQPGRRTMIVFTAHWSNDARFNIIALADYASSVAASGAGSGVKPDFDIIVISTSVKPSQPSYPPSKHFTDAASPYPYPVLADSADNAAAKALAFKTFPWVILADEQGRLVFRFPLAIDTTFMNETVPKIFADPTG